jgi:lia operon protein LiaG
MKRTRLFKLFLSLVVFLVLFSCHQKRGNVITQEFDDNFSGIEIIEIQGAFIEVFYQGMDDLVDVNLKGYIESSEKMGLKVNYRQSGNKLKITVENQSTFSFFENLTKEGFISLKGPKHMKLDIESNSGSVDVQSVNHEKIHLQVNSGAIQVKDLDVREIVLNASSGKISGEDLVGRLNVKVNSGMISLTNVRGDVNAEASSGMMTFDQVNGLLNAKANSGMIKMNNVQELGVIELSSGSAKAVESGLGVNTQFKANSGLIKIQTFSELKDYNFELRANSGSVKLGNQKSGNELSVKNGSKHTVYGKVSSGSIKIYN